MGFHRAPLFVLFFALTSPDPASAQLPAAPASPSVPAAATPTAVPEVAPDSPRSTVTEFLNFARAGKYEEAARFLDVPPSLDGRGPELARKLKLVLDRDLWIDLDTVSPLPEGRHDDGLPPGFDEIGSVTASAGKKEPVRLAKMDPAEGPSWLFSRNTVSRVPAWYGSLDNRVLLDLLPAPLLRPGPREILWWQWIAIVALLYPAWLGGRALGWFTRKALTRMAARSTSTFDDALLKRMGGPFALGWTLVLLRTGLPFLGLYPPAAASVVRLLAATAILAFFWAMLRAVIVAGDVLAEAPWATANAGARSFLSLSVTFGRVLILTLGVLAVLSALGIPVNSVLAGLGIGGIAIAFAAQKTFENFFGAISIGVDQPLRVGDFVKAGDVLGTAENIGLRSTRIRTLDRTLVSIPNGKLADMQIEAFAERDRIRMAIVVGLEYGTTSTKMQDVMTAIEKLLRAHPKVWPDVIVRFVGFGASSLDIDVWAWFQTQDFAEFRDIRQEVLLGIMEIVESNGCSFAFPTRTVHLVGPGGADVPPVR